MDATYDVVVLGGGAGGVPSALRASQLGARVALIESRFLGGLCMNRGCVPFGQMMAATRILKSLSLGKEMGLNFSNVSSDLPTLRKRQNELIAFMRQGIKTTLAKQKVDILEGWGKITGKGSLAVDGKPLSFEKLILATGARWLKPDFPGSDLEGVINSDVLLMGKELPKRVLLFGRDPRLAEIAQFLKQFGSQVWLATADSSVLDGENKTIRTRLARVLRDDGIQIFTKTDILGLEKKGNGLECRLITRDGETLIQVDSLITLERAASLENLGLERIGINKGAAYVTVNEKMETQVAGVYAVGDLAANGARQYSHLAAAGGIVAAENAMGMNSTFDHRTVCRILYTQPQVACVGMTNKEAKKAGYRVLTGTAPLSMNPLGMIMSQNEGIVEVVGEKEYGQVLGVHFIGENAVEMAGQGALAIQMEALLEDLTKTAFPHPALSESLAEAARDALGISLYLP